MATLTVHPILTAGTAGTLAAAAGGGDKLAPGDHVYLEVANGGGSPITVTVDSVTPSNYGTDADLVVSVAAGVTTKIGPLPASRFANATDGLVHVTYSGVTSVTVGAFSA